MRRGAAIRALEHEPVARAPRGLGAAGCHVIEPVERVLHDHLVQRGTTRETPTVGLDPALQTLTTNPYHVGLIIPGAPPASGQPFMYLLAKASAPAGMRLRVRGLRQLITMVAPIPIAGGIPPNYLLEKEIRSPYWHFQDVPPPLWALRRIPPVRGSASSATALNGDGLAFRMTDSPALLFENAASDIGGYTTPYGGQIPGKPLAQGLTSFTDLRFNWRDDDAFQSVDCAYDGPVDVGFFALVQQTKSTHPLLPPPSPAFQFSSQNIPDEDGFVANVAASYSGALTVYYRIAGAIVWEVEPILTTDRIRGRCAW